MFDVSQTGWVGTARHSGKKDGSSHS